MRLRTSAMMAIVAFLSTLAHGRNHADHKRRLQLAAAQPSSQLHRELPREHRVVHLDHEVLRGWQRVDRHRRWRTDVDARGRPPECRWDHRRLKGPENP